MYPIGEFHTHGGNPRGSVIGDRIYSAIVTFFALCIPLLLVLIATEIAVAGWPAFHKFGFAFLTSSRWDPVNGVFGAAPAITALSCIPYGAGHSDPPRPRRCGVPLRVRAAKDPPAGGLPRGPPGGYPERGLRTVGHFVLLPVLRTSVMPFLRDTLHLGVIPLFSGPIYGPSMFAAGRSWR